METIRVSDNLALDLLERRELFGRPALQLRNPGGGTIVIELDQVGQLLAGLGEAVVALAGSGVIDGQELEELLDAFTDAAIFIRVKSVSDANGEQVGSDVPIDARLSLGHIRLERLGKTHPHPVYCVECRQSIGEENAWMAVLAGGELYGPLCHLCAGLP